MYHYDLLPPGTAEAVVAKVPVTGIWGIADRLSKWLNALGIFHHRPT